MPMPKATPQVSSSPFCVKLEAYLIITGRSYEAAEGLPPFAPTKSVPYVTYRGETFGDSQAIIDRFESETSGSYKALDKDVLSADQQAVSREVLDLVENKLYFSLVYARFAMDEGWEHEIEEIESGLPWFLRCCLPKWIRSEQIEKVAKRGCKSADSAFRDIDAWLEHLAGVLGDNTFLFGEDPSVADCSLFGFLVVARSCQHKNPLTTAVRENKRLMDFVVRMISLLKK